MDEEHALSAQSPYAASKIGADQVALSFHRSFGTPVVVVRPFNTYGPRQSARAVVPTIITQIVSGESKLKLGSLQPTRDLSYVDDTVRGIVSALRSDECVGEVVNLGTGFEISVGELALLVAELMGVEIKLSTEKKRVRPARSEVDRLCCDNRKAERCLGWKPEFQGRDGLERGLHATVLWFSNPENLRLYKVGMYNL